MKKNNFDPFMINTFSNLPKQSRFSSIATNDVVSDDLMSITFMEKNTNISIPKVKSGLVIFVTSNSIGENNGLGNSLMKDFFESISSGLELPEYIFFINTGVMLLDNKYIVDVLRKIKKHGTNVVFSIESLKHFNIENVNKTFSKWSVGDITTILVNSKNVIKL